MYVNGSADNDIRRYDIQPDGTLQKPEVDHFSVQVVGALSNLLRHRQAGGPRLLGDFWNVEFQQSL